MLRDCRVRKGNVARQGLRVIRVSAVLRVQPVPRGPLALLARLDPLGSGDRKGQ